MEAKHKHIVLCFAIFVSIINECRSADCVNNEYFGEKDPNNKDDRIGSNTGFGYMVTAAAFTIDCCGTTKAWETEFDNSGTSSGSVSFQIWRLSGSTYTMVGEYDFGVSGNGDFQQNVATAQRVSIQSGDYIGWWSSGTDVVTYKDEGSGVNNNYMKTQTDLAAGDTFDWSGATIVNGRNYAVKLYVQPSARPSFVGLTATSSVVNSATVGTSLFTVAVTDTDPSDVPLLTVAMSGSTQFSYDPATGIVTTADTFTTSDTVTLTFTVTDPCGKTASDTVVVTITNEPPVIHSLPASTTLSEDATLETPLHTINATDSTAAVTCSTTTTDPFTVKLIPGGTEYGVYSNYDPQFVYSTQNTYTIPVVCSDGELTDTEELTVSLVKNQPPVFNNLQGNTALSTAVAIGTNAFTVDVTDPETDSLTFTMTCTPAGAPFEIFASGQIQVSEDLSGQTTVGYDCSITVSDGKNTVGPEILTITFSDINDPVVITNLPLTTALSIPENTATGYLLYTVSYQDLDTTQTRTFTLTSAPSDGTSYFSIDNTGAITTAGSTTNYESGTTSYTFTVTVADPVVSDSSTLTVDITNVNEPPTFAQNSYILTTDESQTVVGTPSFSVLDDDIGDTHTYMLNCGTDTGYFAMDQNTGQVSFQGPYDLDTGSRPTSASCTATVTDSGGLTDTATLDINIGYVNDNVPVFSPASYSFFLGYYDQTSTVVGTVTSTDADAGSHGTQTYTLDQTSLTTEKFTIDNAGRISLVDAASTLGYSARITIVAIASDIGGLKDSANVVIVIGPSTTTVSTTTTDRYRTFIEDNKNVAWLVPCILVILTTLGVLAYIIFTCRGQYSMASCMKQLKCRRQYRPRRRIMDYDRSYERRERTPPPPPPRQLQNISSVRNPPPSKGLQPWRHDNVF